jgi:hypothetical protein
LGWLLGALLPKVLGNADLRRAIIRSGVEKYGTLFFDAVVDSLSKSAEGRDRQGDVLVALRELQIEPRRVAYLEGLSLKGSGDHAGALDRFSAVLAAGEAEPGPLLRYAECARTLGDPAGAERELRKAPLKGSPYDPYDREILDLWLALMLYDLKRSPEEALRGFPWEGCEDHRWLLERFIANETIRIDCGSQKDFRAPDGSVWSRDRFRLGSNRPWKGADQTRWGWAVAKTDLAPLYRTQRWFVPRCGQTSAYRIPLPPGRWRVRLHFAEMYFNRPGIRVFDVSIEGRKVLESYDACTAAGFATADVRSFDTDVTDGLLEVLFTQPQKNLGYVPYQLDAPSIAALEVERIEG